MPTGNSTAMSKKRVGRGRKRDIVSLISPPPNTIAYKGPISFPTSDELTVTLYDSTVIAPVITAQTKLLFDNNPSAARNWTEFSTAWNNYRVLGIRYKFYPNNTVNTTTTPGNFGVQSIVHGTIAVAPNSLAEAMSTGVAKPWTIYKPFTRVWRMQETAEATYTLTSAPAANSNTLVVYASAAPATDNYGTVMVEYLVQFKTHAK